MRDRNAVDEQRTNRCHVEIVAVRQQRAVESAGEHRVGRWESVAEINSASSCSGCRCECRQSFWRGQRYCSIPVSRVMRCFTCQRLGCERTRGSWIAPDEWFVLYADGECTLCPDRSLCAESRLNRELCCGTVTKMSRVGMAAILFQPLRRLHAHLGR
jgi:hypothetical protein